MGDDSDDDHTGDDRKHLPNDYYAHCSSILAH